MTPLLTLVLDGRNARPQLLSASATLASVFVLLSFSMFKVARSPTGVACICVTFTLARCLTGLGQILFADPQGGSCCTRTPPSARSVLSTTSSSPGAAQGKSSKPASSGRAVASAGSTSASGAPAPG